MASVYKTVSKKQNSRQIQPEEPEDMEMDELLANADDTSDSEEEEDDEEQGQEEGQEQGRAQEQGTGSAQKQLASGMMPKTRVLMLTSRGVTSRYASLFFFFF